MAKITIKDKVSEKEWENFLSTKIDANFLQSWYWGEFHRNLNHKIKRSVFFSNDKIIGTMLSVVESAKRGRYLTVPGGPIIDWNNKLLVKAFVNEIKTIAKENK